MGQVIMGQVIISQVIAGRVRLRYHEPSSCCLKACSGQKQAGG